MNAIGADNQISFVRLSIRCRDFALLAVNFRDFSRRNDLCWFTRLRCVCRIIEEGVVKIDSVLKEPRGAKCFLGVKRCLETDGTCIALQIRLSVVIANSRSAIRTATSRISRQTVALAFFLTSSPHFCTILVIW